MFFLRLFSWPFPNLFSSVFNYYRQKKCNLRNFRTILFPVYSHTSLNIPDLSWTTIFKPKLILQLLDNHVFFLNQLTTIHIEDSCYACFLFEMYVFRLTFRRLAVYQPFWKQLFIIRLYITTHFWRLQTWNILDIFRFIN